MNNKKTKIILSAGGTGGHFFSAQTAGIELKERGYDVTILTDQRCWKYTKHCQDLNYKKIDLYINFKSFFTKFISLLYISKAILHSVYYLYINKPDLIVGFGGYPSFPSILAARILGIPLILHEQNTHLGKTNRWFARHAKYIAVSSEGTIKIDKSDQHKLVFVGDLIRKEIRNASYKNDFNNVPLRLFCFGGSQGAKIFNSALPEAIRLAKQKDPNFSVTVIQQLGKDEAPKVQEKYKQLSVKNEVKPFFDNILEIYKKTDLVIARAGAGTIAEVSSLGIPTIFIPLLNSAENHQQKNAKHIKQIGGGWCIEQNKSLPQKLANLLIRLNKDRGLLQAAAKQISKRKKNGAKYLADTIEKIVK